MFEQEATLNRFLISYFQQVVADVPAETAHQRAWETGHPALWILGHLALCVDVSDMVLGGEIAHPEWMEVFGPGSSDQLAVPESYSKDEFVEYIVSGYSRVCKAAANANPEEMSQPHGIELLEKTEIQTRADFLAHLLTTHLSFHLAQLSACRRALGQGPLF